MNKKEKYLIAIAGLFHDIGKFYQRAKKNLKNPGDTKDFKYLHAYYSYKVINEDLKEGLKSVFSNEELNVIIDGTYHHNPKNNTQNLIQKADWISSSERAKEGNIYDLEVLPEDKKEKIKNFARKNPRLKSIFENLKLDKPFKRKNYFYKIFPLEISEDIFPIDLEEAYIKTLELKEEKEENILGSYTKHWENFQNEFNKKLKECNLKFEIHPEKVFSLIYHLLYKYLWCIPASTYDNENRSNHYPDISLFDHSRVLSAIASCFYDFDKDGFNQKSLKEFEKIFKDKDVFLHIKVDIGGIQKFIYNVYQGKGGVAKTLRGRSFYVMLLWETLARYILHKLEYPLSNLLYSGGGIFEILVANTEKNKEKLQEIKKDIETFLASKFEADLGISLATYEYSPYQMTNDYKSVLRNLNENLDNAKKQKFINLLENGEIFNLLNVNTEKIKNNKKKCPVCQTYLIDENLTDDNEICNNCKEFRNIGHYLPRTVALLFSNDENLKEKVSNKEKVVQFSKFGSVYLVTDKNSKDLENLYKDKFTTEILDVNNTSLKDKATGFKFIGKSVPIAIENISPEESGEEETIENGQIVPFTYLAKFSEGDERIGVIRADVDNLGRLFSDGLKDKISISRIATLSRSLDLFFSGYLNKICEKLSTKYKQQYKDAKIKNFFYILYSGGDDVFLVSSWDKAIEIIQEIHSSFKRYTCFNPNITISSGYTQSKPKFPIRVSADIAGEAEEKAKNSGKNKICILGNTLTWDDMEDAKTIAEKWSNYINNGDIQRGFIYAVHKLKEQFLKQGNPMYYPYMQYYIARNISKEELKNDIGKTLLNEKIIEKLDFITNFTALKTRNR